MSEYYGQNLEDKHICEYFAGKTGTFIDIGAYDVIRLSNTRKLYELGWSGILVEPAPANFKGIQEHYKDEPRIQVLNFAIGLSNEPLTFFDSGGDAVGTSDPDHKVKWEGGGVKFTPITVDQMHVVEFMDKYCTTDVRFISIDTEATNMQIFRNIPDWVFERIDAFIIEHDNHAAEIRARLEPFGFKEILFNAENTLLVK